MICNEELVGRGDDNEDKVGWVLILLASTIAFDLHKALPLFNICWSPNTKELNLCSAFLFRLRNIRSSDDRSFDITFQGKNNNRKNKDDWLLRFLLYIHSRQYWRANHTPQTPQFTLSQSTRLSACLKAALLPLVSLSYSSNFVHMIAFFLPREIASITPKFLLRHWKLCFEHFSHSLSYFIYYGAFR